MSKNTILKGAFLLTLTGFITRLIGFFFRIFLSHCFGEEQMGLYQLIFPLYALCFSFSSAGIETALCRCVARKVSTGKKAEANLFLYYALGISVSISLLLLWCLRMFAAPISTYLLAERRCEDLLRVMAFALPFASIHSCICGYYLGLKNVRIPAISQLLEQAFRVGVVIFIFQYFSHSILVAVLGIVVGEFISAYFCLHHYFSKEESPLRLASFRKNLHLCKELVSLALPLTSTRIFTNILQSVETISIPLSLQKYGFTNTNALSTYGVLSGMALPCILFPTAITNALSTMLLPTVAEIDATKHIAKLKVLIQRVIFFGFGLGGLCGIFFFFAGPFLGSLLFQSELTGDFLRVLAWLCPFLYMNTTLISILNGLGKANQSFLINISSLTIRILGVWFGIAFWGINGYLWGLLLSQLLVSILSIIILNSYVRSKEFH